MHHFEAFVFSQMRRFKKRLPCKSADADVTIYGAEFGVAKTQITKTGDQYPFQCCLASVIDLFLAFIGGFVS